MTLLTSWPPLSSRQRNVSTAFSFNFFEFIWRFIGVTTFLMWELRWEPTLFESPLRISRALRQIVSLEEPSAVLRGQTSLLRSSINFSADSWIWYFLPCVVWRSRVCTDKSPIWLEHFSECMILFSIHKGRPGLCLALNGKFTNISLTVMRCAIYSMQINHVCDSRGNGQPTSYCLTLSVHNKVIDLV